jgi:hypothetical protein
MTEQGTPPKKTSKKAKGARSLTAGGILAMFGGAFIVTSGFRTQSFLLTAANYAEQRFGSELPGIAQPAVHFVLIGLSILIGFGGLLAIIGGALVLTNHRTIGKLLIGLGGGFGFIGIAISMGYSVFENGLSIIFLHADYWAGVVVASIGRYLA